MADREQDLRREAAFLLDRLRDFENGGVDDDNARDWYGHVQPSMERLRALCAAPIRDGASSLGGDGELERLSAAATQEMLSVSSVRRRYDEPSCVIVNTPSCAGLFALATGVRGEAALQSLADAKFLVGLWNAFRSGHLVPASLATRRDSGAGASFGPDHSAKPEPEDGLGPTGECSSRGPADTEGFPDEAVQAALRVWHATIDDANVDDDPDDLEHAAMEFALLDADKTRSSLAAAIPSEQVYELGPLDPRPLGLAFGCCSATSPCDHQKRDPMTLCATCERSWQRAKAAHVERIFGPALGTEAEGQDAASGLVHEGPATLVATPQVDPRKEALAVLRTLPPYGLTRHWIDWWRRKAEWVRGEEREKYLARANQVEAALVTLRAEEQDGEVSHG